MDNTKTIDFLNDLKKELENLKIRGGGDSVSIDVIRDKVRMAIRRIYPDYEKVEKKIIPQTFLTGVPRIEETIKAIDIILAEYQVFGFEDFTPQKEKIETEFQIGSEKIGAFLRRKKTK